MRDSRERLKDASVLADPRQCRTLISRALKAALVVICCGVWTSCETQAQTREPDPLPASQELAALTTPWRGVCLAHSWEEQGHYGYGTEASEEVLTHLASIGVNTLSITPFGWMESLDTHVVQGEHAGQTLPGMETRERLVALKAQMDRHRFHGILKPHLWIGRGEWRGKIKPLRDGRLDWDAWWASYREFILYYAKLAEELGFEAFVVGVELTSAVAHDSAPMVELIADVRRVYSGHLTYAANWNEPVPDTIWSALDSVGVQFYPPLSTDNLRPELPAMRDAVRGGLNAWTSVATRVQKPLVLTEVGYRSALAGARYPSAWPEKTPKKLNAIDKELQTRAYQALFAELVETPDLQGVFLWKYFTRRDTTEEDGSGFTPRGKPAEAIIRNAFNPDAEQHVPRVSR